MADNDTTEAAKRQLAVEREATEKSRAEYAERAKGKPTPTQEENDLAVLGAHIAEHEDDGSGPDPHNKALQGSKQSEAQKPASGDYATRQSRAAPAAPPRSTPGT